MPVGEEALRARFVACRRHYQRSRALDASPAGEDFRSARLPAWSILLACGGGRCIVHARADSPVPLADGRQDLFASNSGHGRAGTYTVARTRTAAALPTSQNPGPVAPASAPVTQAASQVSSAATHASAATQAVTTAVARTERDRLLRVPLPSFIRPVLALAALVLVAGALPASAMARSAMPVTWPRPTSH